MRKTQAICLLAAATPATFLAFSGNNWAHMAEAAGVLRMTDCLKCHNGITAKAVVICMGNECLYRNNHSIMSTYPPPGKAGEYAPRSVIEAAGCILEDGKITCLSCHDLTKAPPHLVRDGDALCRTCHLAM